MKILFENALTERHWKRTEEKSDLRLMKRRVKVGKMLFASCRVEYSIIHEANPFLVRIYPHRTQVADIT